MWCNSRSRHIQPIRLRSPNRIRICPTFRPVLPLTTTTQVHARRWIHLSRIVLNSPHDHASSWINTMHSITQHDIFESKSAMERAMDLWKRAKPGTLQQLPPNTFANLLQACRQWNDTNALKTMFSTVSTEKLRQYARACATRSLVYALDAFIENGDIEHAEKVFDALRGRRHPKNYIGLLYLYVAARSFDKVYPLMALMDREGIYIDSTEANAIISYFYNDKIRFEKPPPVNREREKELIENLLARLNVRKAGIHPFLLRTLLKYCEVAKEYSYAKSLWRSLLPHLRTDSKEEIVKCYEKCADVLQWSNDRAMLEHLLNEMHVKKLPVPEKVYIALLGVYTQAGLSMQAQKILVQMAEDGHKPNLLVLNMLLSMYAKHGDVHGAHKMMDIIEEHGFKPNASTYSSLLFLYSSVGDVESIRITYEEAKQNGVDVLRPYALAILAANGPPESVQALREELTQMGKLDAGFMNGMIIYYTRRQEIDTAMDIFEQMKHKRLVPARNSIHALCLALIQNAEPRKLTDFILSLNRSRLLAMQDIEPVLKHLYTNKQWDLFDEVVAELKRTKTMLPAVAEDLVHKRMSETA